MQLDSLSIAWLVVALVFGVAACGASSAESGGKAVVVSTNSSSSSSGDALADGESKEKEDVKPDLIEKDRDEDEPGELVAISGGPLGPPSEGNAKDAIGPSSPITKSRGSADPLSGEAPAAASEVRGSIDKEDIRRVVRANLASVKLCYERELARNPTFEGRLVLRFVIGKQGQVSSVSVTQSTLNHEPTEKCLVTAVRKWKFPEPKGGGVVTISYPFIFRSGE